MSATTADTISFSRGEVREMLLTIEGLLEYFYELVSVGETDNESAAAEPLGAMMQLLEIALGYRSPEGEACDEAALEAIYAEGHPRGDVWLAADRPLIAATVLRPLADTLAQMIGKARDGE